jgi:anti-sigma factor RsiW
MTGPIFSDEDLTAYLDGEAEPALEAALSRALEVDEVLQERLSRLDVPIAAIREGYAALLADAPAMPPLEEPASRNIGWRGFGTFGAGLAAGIAITVATGLFAPTPEPQRPGWKATVASYQSLYGAKTLPADAPSATEQAAQLASVGEAINLDLSDLPNTPGLSFRRAQLLDFGGRPLAQIAFVASDGTPVALCILQENEADDTLVTASIIEDMGAASWQTGTYGFLLIGGDAPDVLAPDAARFAAWSQAVF